MSNLFIRSLDWLARLCHVTGRNRVAKTGLFMVSILAFGGLIWVRTARSADLSVITLPPTFIKATLVNRYVRASGDLLFDGEYDVQTPLLGIFWQNSRFVPMSISGSGESLIVLDEGLPRAFNQDTPVTLVGKVLTGRDQFPDYYLKVMEPPTLAFYDMLAWVCMSLIGGILVAALVNWAVRRVDYAVNTPFGMLNTPDRQLPATAQFILWFGSLGAGYGDVVMRQIPVTFKAIPAEARLMPAFQPDYWAIVIRRLLTVQETTVATTYGALPAMRMEFEDERGITRSGLLAASNRNLMTQVLDVLRFVGQ